jgi:hypothetical protein
MIHDMNDRSQKHNGDPTAPGKIGERTDMFSADTLGDKGGTPEKRAEKKKEDMEFVVFHGQQRLAKKLKEKRLRLEIMQVPVRSADSPACGRAGSQL